MLTSRLRRQKPCPEIGFQNAEQGLRATCRTEGCRQRRTRMAPVQAKKRRPFEAQGKQGRRTPNLRGLACRGGGSGRWGASILGRREITSDLILADFEDDEFVGRHARTAADIELNRLAGCFIFLFYRAVVDENRHSVLGLFE